MPNDYEIYVDPEENEVFFGCMSEREKNICAKLVKHTGSSPKNECNFNKVLDNCIGVNVEQENFDSRLNNEQSTDASIEVFISDLTDSVLALSEFEKNSEAKTAVSENTSFEFECCFQTPMKHKMDKSILATPKSIVKADKDGGFLKVLSEIALVKAEAEADINAEAGKEDEDKENKIISSIPEIKITEATPEKATVLSPSRSINTELRTFKIIYNSPRSEDNIDYKSKSFAENFESEKNFKNKFGEINSDLDVNKVLGGYNKKSVDIMDLDDLESGVLNVSIILDEEGTEIEPQSADDDDEVVISKHVFENLTVADTNESEVNVKQEVDLKSTVEVQSQPLVSAPRETKLPSNLRFSKEARKIVEVLKKSSVEDTLNFTIPEIDVDGEENSFLSPEPVSVFEETVVPNKNLEVAPEETSPKISTKPTDSKLAMKSKTVEKDHRKLTPVISQSKLQSIKYFSERKIYNNESVANKKCAKKLTLEEKKPSTAEIVRGGRMGETNSMSCSRIPVFGAKNSRIPVTERVTRPLTAKNTLAKTPSGKTHKNSKFDHIESPINAYIHNKPTSLVLNVKPELKKDSLTKVLKAQTMGNVPKVEEKTPNLTKPNKNIKLPFVEYKSATPYKIEKRPESRLPRLAPNLMKLIGSHSPKVLKHEGRFYLNTPKKQISAETTIVADPNEVSVVVSQPVLKSNAIK